MARYTFRRLLQAVPFLLGIVVLNFAIIHLAPGDPIQVLVGDYPAPAEYVAQMRARFGLDQPAPVRLVRYLGRVVRGDLGYSFFYNEPVLRVFVERLPATILLMATAILAATALGVIGGVLSARRPASSLDAAFTGFCLFGYSIPVFWLGQIALLVFAVRLDWLPAQGMRSLRASATGWGAVADVAAHLVLPASVLGLRYLALSARLTRASMLQVLQEAYVVAARARGVSERAVVFKHALRNATLPVVTILGVNLGAVIGGAVLTETVFGWPGVGRLMFDAILHRDTPVLLGGLLLISAGVVAANLAVDLLYVRLDPRITYRGT